MHSPSLLWGGGGGTRGSNLKAYYTSLWSSANNTNARRRRFCWVLGRDRSYDHRSSDPPAVGPRLWREDAKAVRISKDQDLL